MKLTLGVLDVPYPAPEADPPVLTAKQARRRRRADVRAAFGVQESVTTGDVAQVLEARYHVMETFYELHAQEIADDITVSLKNSLEDAISGGGPIGNYQLSDSESFIQAEFVKFIDSKEMEGLGIPGVPTQAALDGVNHRMKHPYAKRAPRPSFRDTGLYSQSFRAEFEK